MADKTKPTPHVEGKRKRKFYQEIPSKGPSEVTSQAPRGINVAEYAEARALEIHNMVRALSAADSSSAKRVFQAVPRHMRRRAVSHNVKRLPVRLREAGKKEVRSMCCANSSQTAFTSCNGTVAQRQNHQPFHCQVQKVHSPNLPKEKCISEVVRICVIIIFRLCKLLYEKTVSPYCVFLVRLQEINLKLITLGSEREISV